MPNLTVRNIPKDLYKRMKESAKRRGRSLNAEILAILSDEDGWTRRRLAIAETIPELRRMREEIARKYPNAPDSVELIREDRDSR
jgi:plasmid stability protein